MNPSADTFFTARLHPAQKSVLREVWTPARAPVRITLVRCVYWTMQTTARAYTSLRRIQTCASPVEEAGAPVWISSAIQAAPAATRSSPCKFRHPSCDIRFPLPLRYFIFCFCLLLSAACTGAYAGAKLGDSGGGSSCPAPATFGVRLMSESVQDDLARLRGEVNSGVLSGSSKDLVELALSLTDSDAASAAVSV